jgi:probable phosphomutase (TIGR03848 family)
MTTILLIRHATNDTVGKILAGRMAGVSLNEEGKAQAQKLARRLAHLKLTAIYSSPLERAVETAEPIAKIHNLETTISDDFMELHAGEWTSKTYQEIKEDPRFRNFNTYRSGTRIPGGELMLEAQARILAGLETLYSRHADETVAVVSHADIIKAAVAYYAGIHLDLFQRIEISPASVSIIRMFDETVRILLVNDTGEIDV